MTPRKAEKGNAHPLRKAMLHKFQGLRKALGTVAGRRVPGRHMKLWIHVCLQYTYVYIYIYTVAEVGNLDAEVSIGARWLAPGGAVAEVSDKAQVGWR